MRIHFFSVILQQSGWVICEADFEIRQPYSGRQDAIQAARHLALHHWQATGESTAVRVARAHGGEGWIDVVCYGSGSLPVTE